jgi:predicted RNA-binding protein with RPS1 domain
MGDEIPLSGMKDTEGLVHISEIAPFRLASMDGVANVGDTVPVIIKELGEEGKIKLSIKDADPDFAVRKGLKEGTSAGGDFRSGGDFRRPGGSGGYRGGSSHHGGPRR